MNDRNRKRLRRGQSARDLMSSLADSFAAGSKGAESVARIIELVESINALDASSATNARTLRAALDAQDGARKELRNLLRTISRTSRPVGIDDPALKDKFRMPTGSMSDQVLLSTARSFVLEATPIKDRFVAYGMSANFPDALAEKITALEGQASLHHTSKGARASDNAAATAALDELDREIERLDTIMRNTFAADPATLAAWDIARHLERIPKKRKDKGASGNTPPAGHN
jgi:hypothetical protein